jgi:hypothetical protein
MSTPDTLNLLLIRGIDGLSIDSHSYVALQKAHPTTVLVFCLQSRLVLNRASPTLSSLFRPAAYNHMMWLFIELDQLAKRIDGGSPADACCDWVLEKRRLDRAARQNISNAVLSKDKAQESASFVAHRELHIYNWKYISYYCRLSPIHIHSFSLTEYRPFRADSGVFFLSFLCG